METFTTGAQRDTQSNKPRYTLIEVKELESLRDKAAPDDTVGGYIDWTWFNEVQKVLAAGAKKYGTKNWQKGIPLMRCVDSLLRHIKAFIDGDGDENHLANASCNLMFLHYYDRMLKAGRLPSYLDDRPEPLPTNPMAWTLIANAEEPPVGSERWALKQMDLGRRVTHPNESARGLSYAIKNGVIGFFIGNEWAEGAENGPGCARPWGRTGWQVVE